MNFPENLKYTQSHEWAKIEGQIAEIGITEHAQNALGDIVYLELPKVGRVLKAGETFGVVESIKAVSDLYSPFSGKVLEINSQLADNPGQINQDPYEHSWIIKLEIAEAAPIQSLFDSKSYSQFVEKLK
jgi:glycine cleavage system H protein